MEILGLVPAEAYSLRETSSGLCLQELNKDSWVMTTCSPGRGQVFVNKNARAEPTGSLNCCAGLGPRHTLSGSNLYCLDHRNGDPGPWPCSFWPPTPASQQWQLTSSGQLENPAVGCLVPLETRHGEVSAETVGSGLGGPVRLAGCKFASKGKAPPSQRFTVHYIDELSNSSLPLESSKFIVSLENGLCLSAVSADGAVQNSLSVQPCKANDANQEWKWIKVDANVGLKTATLPARCVDLNGGNAPLLYGCYSMSDPTVPGGIQNTNQALWLSAAGHISQWGPVDVSLSNLCLEGSAQKESKLGTIACAEAIEKGIHWEKVGAHVPLETRLMRQYQASEGRKL